LNYFIALAVIIDYYPGGSKHNAIFYKKVSKRISKSLLKGDSHCALVAPTKLKRFQQLSETAV